MEPTLPHPFRPAMSDVECCALIAYDLPLIDGPNMPILYVSSRDPQVSAEQIPAAKRLGLPTLTVQDTPEGGCVIFEGAHGAAWKLWVGPEGEFVVQSPRDLDGTTVDPGSPMAFVWGETASCPGWADLAVAVTACVVIVGPPYDDIKPDGDPDYDDIILAAWRAGAAMGLMDVERGVPDLPELHDPVDVAQEAGLPTPLEVVFQNPIVYPVPPRRDLGLALATLWDARDAGGEPCYLATVSNFGDGLTVTNGAGHLLMRLRAQFSDRPLTVMEYWPAGEGIDPAENLDEVVPGPEVMWRRIWPTSTAHPAHQLLNAWIEGPGAPVLAAARRQHDLFRGLSDAVSILRRRPMMCVGPGDVPIDRAASALLVEAYEERRVALDTITCDTEGCRDLTLSTMLMVHHPYGEPGAYHSATETGESGFEQVARWDTAPQAREGHQLLMSLLALHPHDIPRMRLVEDDPEES